MNHGAKVPASDQQNHWILKNTDERKKTTNKKKTETGKKGKKSMEMCTKPMKKIRHRINKMNNFGKNNGTSE